VADHLPAVFGDVVHLQQVLLNLIVNGMYGIDEAKAGDRRVSVTASLEIAVSGFGRGIPADTLAHFFDPFFATGPKGVGIGLPISRTIVEAHEGRPWAENQSGGGASFRFTLPVAKEGVRK